MAQSVSVGPIRTIFISTEANLNFINSLSNFVFYFSALVNGLRRRAQLKYKPRIKKLITYLSFHYSHPSSYSKFALLEEHVTYLPS